KLDHVVLDELKVVASRDSAGQLNLQRMVPLAQAEEHASTEDKPWTVTIPDIALRAADLALDDQRASQVAHFHLTPLDLTVSGFGIPNSGPLRLDIKSGVNESGRFEAHGQLDVEALSGRFAIDAASLPMAPLQPY